jgi:hypothetical protein
MRGANVPGTPQLVVTSARIGSGEQMHVDVQPNDDTTFEVPEHVLARKTGEEMVVLNLDNEQYYGLDEVGTRLWELIDGGATFGAVVDTLLAEYEVDRATLVDDLTSILDDLHENGLVVAG